MVPVVNERHLSNKYLETKQTVLGSNSQKQVYASQSKMTQDH